MSLERPWQVLLHLGMKPAPAKMDGVRILDVTAREALVRGDVEPQDVLSAVQACGIGPGDLRSKTAIVVTTEGCDATVLTRHCILTYTVMTGFSGRRIDVIVDGVHLDAPGLHEMARNASDAGRPEVQVQLVAAGYEDLNLESVSLGSGRLSPAEVSTVRYGRRVRLSVPDAPALALAQLVLVAGIRMRDQGDRFPVLLRTPAHWDSEAESGIADGDIDLDALRRAASAIRRTLVSSVDGALVERLEPSPRIERLRAAAAADLESVMLTLGARQDPRTGDWHCPRPDRHTNGDRNASMKLVRNRTRCYRCDAERIDSLRLVMDCLHVSPDEAADWLEASVGLGDPNIVVSYEDVAAPSDASEFDSGPTHT